MKSKEFCMKLVVPIVVGIIGGVGGYLITQSISERKETIKVENQQEVKEQVQEDKILKLECESSELSKTVNTHEVRVTTMESQLETIVENTNEMKLDIKKILTNKVYYGITDNRDNTVYPEQPESGICSR